MNIKSFSGHLFQLTTFHGFIVIMMMVVRAKMITHHLTLMIFLFVYALSRLMKTHISMCILHVQDL